MSEERKVAIVTGSATGVGAAAAIMLAEKGINVVINYTRSKDEAEETAEACRAHGVEAITFQSKVGKTRPERPRLADVRTCETFLGNHSE